MSFTVRVVKGRENEVKKWQGYVELPRRADGTRNRKKTRLYSRKRDAENAAREIENQYLYGSTNPHYNYLLVSDLCVKFFDDNGINNKKPSTIENYHKQIRNHIKPAFGDYVVSALNYEIIQSFINELADKGYKYDTLVNIKGVFSVLMEFAKRKLQCIEKNPVKIVEIPERAKKNKGLTTQHKNTDLTDEDIEALFERFDEGDPNFLPLLIGYRCGLRSGEIYGLTWDRIDLEHRKMTIDRQLQYYVTRDHNGKKTGSYWALCDTKYNNNRRIMLDQYTADMLRKEKQRQEAEKAEDENYITIYVDDERINYEGGEPVDFVIKKPHGDFKSSNTRQHIGRVAHKDLDIGYTLHSLRHTYATKLNDAGLPMDYIQHRLGHSSQKTTEETYITKSDKYLERFQDVIDDVFDTKKTQED